jgi:hypothetical protein
MESGKPSSPWALLGVGTQQNLRANEDSRDAEQRIQLRGFLMLSVAPSPPVGSNPGWDLFKNVPDESCESTFEDWLRGLATTYTEHVSITCGNRGIRPNQGQSNQGQSFRIDQPSR